MNLFQRLKIRKDLKQLERRAHEEPSPTTFVDLGQVYINLGISDKAAAIAEQGLALFPQSEELTKLRAFARRTSLKERIDGLRQKLVKSPNARVYRELAALYLELGDIGAVHGTCEECIRRFPEDPGAHLVLAQARLASFYRDLVGREGLEAVHDLQRALQLDPQLDRARMLLAEVCHRIGATSIAVQHLEHLRATGHADQESTALWRQASGQAALGTDLEELFSNVEAAGSLPNPPATQPVRPQQPEDGINRIRDALAQVAELPGVRKAAYIKGTRALVKGDVRDGRDPFLRVARVVAKASHRFAKRMDIGNFSKGVLDGRFGHVGICCYGEVVAAVQCDAGTPMDRVLADLQELVAGSLYLAGASES
jgi:tetratricopeptide (TPR) repeat protein